MKHAAGSARLGMLAVGLGIVAAAAGNGSDDIARVVGDKGVAFASYGNYDIASVRGDNDTAFAGNPGDHETALVFGDGLSASASGMDWKTDIAQWLG